MNNIGKQAIYSEQERINSCQSSPTAQVTLWTTNSHDTFFVKNDSCLVSIHPSKLTCRITSQFPVKRDQCPNSR